MKRKIAAVLCAVLSLSMLAGCGAKTGSKSGEGENIEIKIGYWPNPETEPEKYEVYKGYVEAFKEKRPDVTVIPDEFNYSNDTIMPAAAAGQLPNIYRVPFTEPKNIVEAGFARDITDIMKKRGYDTALNKDLLDIVTGNDGKYYGVPYNGYMMGMWYNVNLFKQAGLVNADGTLQYPTTYDEVIETAKIITEKTGQPGFAFQCKDAECGWNFMNIAWSYGVKFMEQGSDGKWKATFASPECVKAMEYIRDLKWKHNVIPSNILLDRGTMYKLFATDQLGMSICAEDWLDSPVQKYNMSKDHIGTSPIPAGPAGRYAQTGGDAWMFSKETTDEQLEALFDWLEIVGNAPEMSDIAKTNVTNDIKAMVEKGKIILTPAFSVWNDEERKAATNDLYKEYINVDPTIHVNMLSDDVKLHAEEPQQTQQLYRTVASVIQEILTNENADIAGLLQTAQENFQKDFLDKQ